MNRFLISIFVSAVVSTGAVASAAAEPTVTQAVNLAERAAACTFTGNTGAAQASASQRLCSTIVLSDVAVPSGQALDLDDLQDDTTVRFEGETTWGFKQWEGPLLRIKGTRITVEGAKGASLNPDGARWWDGQGGNGGKTKPKFFAAHGLKESQINNVHIKNTPVQAVSISSCEGLTITDMIIDNKAGDKKGGHNTDAFDIGSSSRVSITGAQVYNQDDCVAVNSGSDIIFSGGLCSGGHGLSIGSVGGRDDNTVNNVRFENSRVQNSDNGIRVKAKSGETGSIKGVTYSGITLQNISKYGILIEQNYNGGDLHGEPTSGLPITGLKIEHISGKGAVKPSGHNIAIVCGSSACSGWTWTDVSVTGGKDYDKCKNVPSVASCST